MGHGLYYQAGRARGMGAEPGFGDVCKVMTVSLQRNGCFHWSEIREVLGEEAYAGMQRWRDPERVWVVRHGGAGSVARGTILDHATVMESEEYGCATTRHTLPRAPSSARPDGPTCDVYDMKIANHEQWHRLSPGAAGSARPGLIEEIVRSFREAVAMEVEEEVCGILSSMPDERFALVDYDEYAARITDIDQTALSANMISGAGAAIARVNPEVAFPQGIVAMVSPEQASQLHGDATVELDAGSVQGIDIVTSTAVRYDKKAGGYAAIVASKGGIYVSLSPMEIHAFKEDGDICIVARYGVGAAVKPGKAAKVFSYRR